MLKEKVMTVKPLKIQRHGEKWSVTIFFGFGAVTSKLAQIVLINDNNNLCEGISQKFKIEHKREKCNMQHVAGAAY